MPGDGDRAALAGERGVSVVGGSLAQRLASCTIAYRRPSDGSEIEPMPRPVLSRCSNRLAARRATPRSSRVVDCPGPWRSLHKSANSRLIWSSRMAWLRAARSAETGFCQTSVNAASVSSSTPLTDSTDATNRSVRVSSTVIAVRETSRAQPDRTSPSMAGTAIALSGRVAIASHAWGGSLLAGGRRRRVERHPPNPTVRRRYPHRSNRPAREGATRAGARPRLFAVCGRTVAGLGVRGRGRPWLGLQSDAP